MSLPVREPHPSTDVSLSLQFDEADADLLARAFRTPGDGPRAWHLNCEAHRLSLVHGFDRLLAWPSLRGVARYPHQERTCLRVLQEMRGRAILADEVGLGKTIEAGLVLKEYAIRGLVRRALILTPASLTGQWREEMESKFDLPFAVLRSLGDWEDRPYLVASIDLAKRGPQRSAAQSRPWDLVIVDEAHRLKNRLSVNWRFVAGLSKKYMLLLTATPVQNDMEELFNLVSVLKPGALRTYEGFIDRYVGSRDRRVPANVPELRDRLRDVMIRHRRGIAFTLPPRRVHSLPVRLSPAERRLYDDVTDFVRDAYWSASGRMSWAARSCQGDRQGFLSTEAGGEGRNLQFARTVVNYDLPWNPLRIEQRIGRVHRLGQEREVHVVNLWARETVEAYLMELLDRKIHMFELVVGELDLILGNLAERRSFEDMMMEIWALREAEERRAALHRLGEALVRARTEYDRMQERNEEALRPVSEEVAA